MKGSVIKQNVGIDISKDDYKVNFQDLLSDQKNKIKGSRAFKNNLSGFKDLVSWVDKRKAKGIEVRITVEATGVYYEQLVHYLNDKTDYRISVVLPNKSKAYFKSFNVKSKTDKIDAKILGQMGLERNLAEWKPISNNMLLLKQLTRDRVSIVEHTTRLKNRLHALEHSHNPSKQVLKRLKAQIRLYDRQRKEVELQIEEAIETDELLQERIEKISQVKGLGIVTIATVVAETDGFNLFTSKSQLVSYCGYDVVQEESGTSVKKKGRISKKGNKYIRRALYFPSVTTIQYEKNFSQLYERVYERTGMKMKGLVAVQRKLLILIYTLFKKNENYNSEHTLEAAPIEMQNADSAPIL